MPYISIRGVEHYYEWLGESLSGNKPIMVFIHGWGGSSRYWQSTATALVDKFDCLLYDLRGFGRSGVHPTANLGYELTSYVQDLAILLDMLRLERVYIHAHSMGTSIATLFVSQHQQRVEKLILTCGGIFTYDEKAFAAFYRFGGYVVKFRPPWLLKLPFLDRIFMARFLHRAIIPEERRAFLEDFLLADYHAALGTMFACVSQEQAELLPQKFAQLALPTLMISGEFDKIIPVSLGKEAAALNQMIEFQVIPQTGHFPMLEDEATYLQTLGKFL
ncbi:alpha/beta fold hydrolase [Calothrix sp. 336/3]|uniref:alpha/beta fold hydrolase n=1 Tax=Calothrix sp. 336/3 TaxID=1337936 RepID=UPI0004E395BA|nr:alpha/beta hydrolase [Calothrix sp. 336/3]AKG21819.1 alpha/beta hydrolase [Calothrix sp. 336/3]